MRTMKDSNRPPAFASTTQEVLFVSSVCLAQILVEFFVSGFDLLLPAVSEDLEIPSDAQTWPASSFSLVVACFLLAFGRVTDMVGGKLVYLFGLGWLLIWSVVCAVSVNEAMLNVARAMQGFGPAAFIPSTISLMGKTYAPGRRKNIVFSLYGFSAVAGFMIGFFFAGITAQFTTWRWYFGIGAILSALSFGAAVYSIPMDYSETRAYKAKMDFWGLTVITSGLILIVYALIDSSRVTDGWRTPHIPTLFSIGVVLLVAGFWGEHSPRLTHDNPLLPPSIWRASSFTGLLISLLFSFGCLGVFLLYSVFWFDQVLGISAMLQVAYFLPLAIGGFVLSLGAGSVLHKVPSTMLIIFSTLVLVIPPLLFIFMPLDGSISPAQRYWSYIFPSMLCATLGIDINFNIANIYISTTLPVHRQGLAGSLIQATLELGFALALGFAEVISHGTMRRLTPLEQASRPGRQAAYTNVFWFEFACAIAAFLLAVAFVRVGAQGGDGDASQGDRELEPGIT
ncbi:Putative uncharacterized protein [Taphrina deformans PYCC 5710]|uniref:Major facilitator superfamily (MFS) profile domain-containing protein n=1 Tax=Taphrina deformans (strain PYCC 5710 / ATCC 11124 / CBS 356.35 / IMI 108563 / JCM 9778 / NBRC 8474) TaxID=1097556 RepID=R4ZY62_TAPDE|nr:Putative uncharacterized protein [Taphrina deformans PYCC 5710]|eukprot:CCX35448.1 Putative uncharacterized protein [Taphrina deformans PYCC 5710]